MSLSDSALYFENINNIDLIFETVKGLIMFNNCNNINLNISDCSKASIVVYNANIFIFSHVNNCTCSYVKMLWIEMIMKCLNWNDR